MADFTFKAGSVKDYGAKWLKWVEARWLPGKRYQAGEHIRPTVRNGFEYECTQPGVSLDKEPVWPVVADQTIQDGVVEWTCRANAENAIDPISASHWELPNDLSIGDGIDQVVDADVGNVTPLAPDFNATETVAHFYSGVPGVYSVINKIKTVGGLIAQQVIEFEVK